jgi:hypothetical protein
LYRNSDFWGVAVGKQIGRAVTRALFAAAIAGASLMVGLPGARADALPACATPTVSAHTYAQGSANTVTWTVSGTRGSGFIAEVGLTPDFAHPEQTVGSIAADANSFTFTGLSEARHFYHVRTKTLSGVCSASAWSTLVATVQDATPPVVTITTPQDGDVETGSTLTVAGTIVDLPGGTAPSGSGPNSILVGISACVNVSYGNCVGPAGSQSQSQFTSGAWSVTFSNLSSGPYLVTVAGIDNVSNYSIVNRAVLVAAPPSFTALDGAGDGTVYMSGGDTVVQAFHFDGAGTFEGEPAAGSYSCEAATTPYTGNVPDLQCAEEETVLSDVGIGGVLPPTTTIANVSFVLIPSANQNLPSAIWTLTGSVLTGQTLRCGGIATSSGGSWDEFWYLTAPDVSCTVT